MKKQPKHPCINCIYFKACGDTTRTMPCNGRLTKRGLKQKIKALEQLTEPIDERL